MIKYIVKGNEFVFGETGRSFVCVEEGATDRQIWFDESVAKEQDNCVEVNYSIQGKKVFAKSHVEIFDGIDVFRQTNAVWGEGRLMQVASQISGVCEDKDGIYDRLSDGSILIHYCINRWQCEGQWRCATPEDLGIIAGTIHLGEKSAWRIESLSSFSTALYYPLIIVEDKKKNQCWYFELEGGKSWFIEVSGSYGLLMKSLTVTLGAFDERLGCNRALTNEEYCSATCIYGVTEGGIEDAIKMLTIYKRKTSLVQGLMPLVFNDYMNCNWALESREKLLPLIDSASRLGAEIFCIDDGWSIAQGIWEPDDEKVGGGGWKEIFDYIHAKNMKVGVWFEFESLSWRAKEFIGAEDCLLMRNGKVIDENRPLANMRSKAVIDYLNKCVDYMYNLGVRYIKNDHNNNELLGTNIDGENAGTGLEENEKVFLTFIDGLRERYPDLIIENCGSGAMRSDNGTLRHFHLQSTSDQEFYNLYPTILAGSLALMPAEKAGIWCYPYPLAYDNRNDLAISEDVLQGFIDGEQTIFNFVNGCMGCMYLSGKIHQADAYNFSLMKEGVELWKSEREFIKTAYPIYPKGMARMSIKTDYAVGLTNGDRALIAVWNLSDGARNVKVDLSKYKFLNCEQIYPKKKDVETLFDGVELSCKFSKGKMARLFLLTK